MQVLEARIA